MTWMTLLLTLTTFGATVEVDLKREVIVQGEEIHLRDLVSDASFAALERKGVGNPVIAPSPPVQQKRVIRPIQIETVLNRTRHSLEVAWRGAKAVLVSRKGMDFSSTHLETAVRDWVHAQSNGDYTYRLERVLVPSLRQIPKGSMRFDIRQRGNRGMIGRNSLAVDLIIDGDIHKTLIVQATISAEVLVATVNHDLDRGQPLTERDVSWDYRRLDRLTAPLVTPEDFIGLSAKTLVRAGTMLTQHHVKITPLVERNRPCTVVARSGGLTIRMKALSLDNGGAGETVRLKNMQSGKMFVGKVARDGQVHVDMAL